MIYEKSIESGEGISEDSVFIRIEAANENVINPFDIINDSTENYTFKFTGQFYKEKQRWLSEEHVEYKTRLFRYKECIIKK